MSGIFGQLQKFYSDVDNKSVVIGGVTLAAAGAIAYIMSGPRRFKSSIDMNCQSIELEDGSRISAYLTKEANMMEYRYEDARTLHETFLRGRRLSGNQNCLGSRTGPNKEYVWLTYNQVYEKACNFGSGLLKLGMKPGEESFLGIYSINRVEWVVSEQACNAYSLVSVPLYDTLGATSCEYIINQTEMNVLVCDSANKAVALLTDAGKLPHLKNIIMIGDITDELKSLADKHNITLHRFIDIENLGRENRVEPIPPKPSDLATLCYTSGTTGEPKGAMLTHGNIVSNISAVFSNVEEYFKIQSSDVHISYLPLAHMFERGVQVMMYMHGGQIGFSQGDIKLLTDDLQTLKPTLFPTVPRLLNRMYEKVMIGVKGSKIKSYLLDWGLKSKFKEVQRGVIRKDGMWDKILFNKIQNLLGGRIRGMITGSAPLSDTILNFARACFGCMVVEGYGQTEATAGITFNIPGEIVPGHCGPPLMCNRVKLIDVPEMDYKASEGSGEIIAKGPNVFKGYYKNPEKTAEALDKDGWLHTGDIGKWLPNGTLKIIDRKKNIFKLAQGEYIAAEKIENVYQRSPFVAQVFLEGDSYRHCVMAVIVLDEEYLAKWNNNNNNKNMSLQELSSSQEIKDTVYKDLMRCGKEAKLKGFEQVKDIYIHPELFSIENGLMTPTFKNKRPALRKYFQPQIEELYSKLNE